MKARPTAHDSILDAAENLVCEAGAAHLTLDGVAEKAGVSKGGLLYHFPNKEALLHGMVDRQVKQFETLQAAFLAGTAPTPEARMKAFIQAGLDSDPKIRQLCAAFLAMAANHPELLKRGRELHAQQLRELRQAGVSEEKAALLWLACSGLWFMEVLQLSPFSENERQSVTAYMLRIAEAGA